MLKALYNFKATFAKTLSFREDDHFILHQTNIKQRNWWQVINDRGEIGFVPSNYVEKVNVNPLFMLQFLDDCLINLQNEQQTSSTLDKQELVLRIKEKRRQTELNMKSTTESKTDITNSMTNLDIGSTTSYPTTDTEKTVPDLLYRKNSDVIEEPIKPVRKQNTYSNDFQEDTHIVKPEISRQDVFDLVELVRINTKLSHEMSQVAVHTVVSHLQHLLPKSVSAQLSQILSMSETSLVINDTAIDETHDANRLKHIFKELTDCKEDSQQRSWMLYEDEHVITEYITELISILVSYNK